MPRKFLLFRTQSGSAWSTINIGTQGGGVILSNNNKTAQVTNNNGALGDTLITKKTYWEITTTIVGPGSYIGIGIGKLASPVATILGDSINAGGAWRSGSPGIGTGFLNLGGPSSYVINNAGSAMSAPTYPAPSNGFIFGISFDPILGILTIYNVSTGASYGTFPYSGSTDTMTTGDWYPWVGSNGSPNTFFFNSQGPFTIPSIPSGYTGF